MCAVRAVPYAVKLLNRTRCETFELVRFFPVSVVFERSAFCTQKSQSWSCCRPLQTNTAKQQSTQTCGGIFPYSWVVVGEREDAYTLTQFPSNAPKRQNFGVALCFWRCRHRHHLMLLLLYDSDDCVCVFWPVLVARISAWKTTSMSNLCVLPEMRMRSFTNSCLAYYYNPHCIEYVFKFYKTCPPAKLCANKIKVFV